MPAVMPYPWRMTMFAGDNRRYYRRTALFAGGNKLHWRTNLCARDTSLCAGEYIVR
jgi:hypothetical protein